MMSGFDTSVLEAIPLPTIYVDANARIVGANERAIALRPQASRSLPFIVVFRHPALNSAIEDCLATGKLQRAIYHHSDGPQDLRFEAQCSIAKLGHERGVMICLRDVTELRQLDQMRRDFVANVSHELRTPLTAILGFIETIQGPAKNDIEAQQRFLKTMAAEASRMNRLVGDLLSLSKVEEVSRMRPTDMVDIDAQIRSALRNLSPLAEERQSTLIYKAKEQPVVVAADSDQILQVITNLVENALKYGGQGTTVNLTLDEVNQSGWLRGPGVRITVADDGPGIDPLHIPRLTERFYRIDSHRSREMGGTGLGLAIVKHIINRHRGRLTIESTLEKGSEFGVILPKS